MSVHKLDISFVIDLKALMSVIMEASVVFSNDTFRFSYECISILC